MNGGFFVYVDLLAGRYLRSLLRNKLRNKKANRTRWGDWRWALTVKNHNALPEIFLCLAKARLHRPQRHQAGERWHPP